MTVSGSTFTVQSKRELRPRLCTSDHMFTKSSALAALPAKEVPTGTCVYLTVVHQAFLVVPPQQDPSCAEHVKAVAAKDAQADTMLAPLVQKALDDAVLIGVQQQRGDAVHAWRKLNLHSVALRDGLCRSSLGQGGSWPDREEEKDNDGHQRQDCANHSKAP
eukprot:CAMPEP_0171124982 /NCGR_PEP_ID=MMETSP0766_2-20121228/110335_1 /TAXON_ID=439317 /ORGANISM="Gambierdiscus australes, Strain CAWD 149" /LENGTH=161 /DNA_ID=CAMNT_0011587941 /DNA_START=312 /DNA_END=796 /DNA_ORIENTATION=-